MSERRVIAVTDLMPWLKSPARFLEKKTYYHRCYCICKWETSLPKRAEEDLKGVVSPLGWAPRPTSLALLAPKLGGVANCIGNG